MLNSRHGKPGQAVRHSRTAIGAAEIRWTSATHDIDRVSFPAGASGLGMRPAPGLPVAALLIRLVAHYQFPGAETRSSDGTTHQPSCGRNVRCWTLLLLLTYDSTVAGAEN